MQWGTCACEPFRGEVGTVWAGARALDSSSRVGTTRLRHMRKRDEGKVPGYEKGQEVLRGVRGTCRLVVEKECVHLEEVTKNRARQFYATSYIRQFVLFGYLKQVSSNALHCPDCYVS